MGVVTSIESVALEKRYRALAQELVDRQILRDLIALKDAMEKDGQSPSLSSLRLFPSSLLQWLGDRFTLEPIGRIGDPIELPVSKLKNYLCDFEISGETDSLVECVVVELGWKYRGETLVRPRLRIRAAVSS